MQEKTGRSASCPSVTLGVSSSAVGGPLTVLSICGQVDELVVPIASPQIHSTVTGLSHILEIGRASCRERV